MSNAALQIAQQAYDNRQPEEHDDEHFYTGDIEIDDMMFQFCDGHLEDVVVPGYLFEADIDRTLAVQQADAAAWTLWTKELSDDFD